MKLDIVRTVREKVVREHTYSKMSKIPDGRARGGITEGCLVLEGGAFRGLYTQGLLDYWMRHGLNISCVIGVSAGALSGVSYISGQIGRSARANIGFRHDSNYIGVEAIRKAHSLIRLDFLLQDLNRIEPLDMEAFNDPRRRLIAVATNCDTGRPEYFESSNCSDMMAALKASASMPYISPMVEVDGKRCLDGGCSCAIPYQWALDQGFEKVVVVKTHDRTFRIPEAKEGQTARRVYLKHPEFAKALDESDVRYNRQYDEMDELQRQGRIMLVQPSEVVTVSRVEGDLEKLGELYWLGYSDGAKTFDEVVNYLGADIPSHRTEIRDATEEDARSLLDIYRPYVEDTAITFELQVPTVQDFQSRIRRTLASYPYLVAQLDGDVVGYAYASILKDREAYRPSAEVSIYLRRDMRSSGIGKRLYQSLEERLRGQGVLNLYACISYTETEDEHLDNGSVLFHEHMGYTLAGHFHGCGRKFGKLYDVVWMEKRLQ